MGLLAKAALILARQERAVSQEGAENQRSAGSVVTPDDRGNALIDRIKKLSGQRIAPYIALGLIKNYGGFHAGAFLTLKDGYYYSYTSVGMGLGNFSIPEDRIFLPGREEKFFSLSQEALQMGISFLDPASSLWIFPLDENIPWTTILILVSPEKEKIKPEMVSVLLPEISGIIVPQGNPLETAIIRFNAENPVFSGILIRAPGNMDKKEKLFFLEKLSRMVSMAGKIILLPEKTPDTESGAVSPLMILILLPQSTDKRLIAHHLDAALPVNIAVTFEAENPAEALGKLELFL